MGRLVLHTRMGARVMESTAQFGLIDRVAVVTGASDGIGRMLASGLARAGARYYVVYPAHRKIGAGQG